MTVAVLGLDPAWTVGHGSGVSLIERHNGRWRCRGVAPTYAEFVRLGHGEPVAWTARTIEVDLDVAEILGSASALSSGDLVLAAADIPCATVDITGRREADRSISREFGDRGCSTHSPSATRPGPVGARLTAGFARSGFLLATTTDDRLIAKKRLIEVYQHPALLYLLSRTYRVPYKLARISKYWKNESSTARVALLLKEWKLIEDALRSVIDDIELPVPSLDGTAANLKRYEDALDALLAAWIGSEFVAGRITPYGDETAAIWVPSGQAA